MPPDSLKSPREVFSELCSLLLPPGEQTLQVVSEGVDEAAKNVNDLHNQGLALMVRKTGRVEAVLYKPSGKLLNKWSDPHRADPNQGSVIGIVAISADSNLKDTQKINVIAARGGSGPFMYDLALWLASPKWLVSDRGSASQAAQKVWNYYLNKRPDIERRPIRNPKALYKPEESADEQTTNALNYQFRMKSKTTAPSFKKLIENHHEFLARCAEEAETDPGYRVFEDLIWESGQLFFNLNYNL